MPRYRELVENLAIDGISDILNSKGCGLRTLWIIFFIFGTTACAQQLFMLISGFISDKHWRSNLESVLEPEGLQFPSLTICNLNRVNRTKAESDFKITNEMLNEILKSANFNESMLIKVHFNKIFQ